MSQVELHIDQNKKEFILKGATQEIVNNRRLKFYLFNTLNAKIVENGSITIGYNEKEKEQLLKNIQETLDAYEISQADSVEIKEVLVDYYKEKENFREFSQKARKIWDNIVNEKDFSAFKTILENSFPKRRLYPQQLLASFHLAFSQNACNFSVPGAGKTSIVYGAYTYLKSLPESDPKKINKLLIIGPLSSFGPWEDEFEECFGYRTRSKRLSGGISKEERDRYLLSIDPSEEMPELTLMSYQSVSYNLNNLYHFLQRKGDKTMVVLDEAHKIKNVDGGIWAQSVLSIAQYCKSRVILTGTPVPNGYEDIYNLYEFIWPKKEIINYNIFQLKEMSSKPYDPRIETLISDISPFFIRIKKKDILDPLIFPIKEESPTYVEMGKIQREIYEFIENKYISYFTENDPFVSASTELTKARFIRLMQVAINPALLRQPLENYFKDQGLSNELYIDDSNILNKILEYKKLEDIPPKFVKAKELIQMLLAKKEKVIVWATFIQNVKEFQQYLKESGIESRCLIGETPVERDDINMDEVETREKIIKAFHNPESSFKVIIANPFAVAESISLHKACHNAVYLERTFNAGNFIQSKDRIHRVGLEPGVITHYYYILSKDSIDETIHTRLIGKEKRMLELIENQDIPLISQNMNYDIDLKDDIKAIIRDYVRRSAKI
jgi:SNF2 family DNA or RNA helicase